MPNVQNEDQRKQLFNPSKDMSIRTSQSNIAYTHNPVTAYVHTTFTCVTLPQQCNTHRNYDTKFT